VFLGHERILSSEKSGMEPGMLHSPELPMQVDVILIQTFRWTFALGPEAGDHGSVLTRLSPQGRKTGLK
jgi:hypothetical protein